MCNDTLNAKCSGTIDQVHGMIDSNALINSAYTWPSTCGRVKDGTLNRANIADTVKSAIKNSIKDPTTKDIGNSLVKLNTEMYKKISGNSNKKGIPSLIVASTMDMGLAHLDGYNGVVIGGIKAPTQCWEDQIKDAETAVVANPLRLFPLFSYDPRRYRRPSGYHLEKGHYNNDIYKNLQFPKDYRFGDDNACKPWDDPFKYIIGSDDLSSIKKSWLGFSMNPQLGFRPFDELCAYLPEFYEKCQDKQIPILAHCTPDGITTHEAEAYESFDEKNRIDREKKSKERHKRMKRENKEVLYSNKYQGTKDIIVDDPKLNHFHNNYGHPRNWIPVLKHYQRLRLCFAGFGGNSEWQHDDMSKWAGLDVTLIPRRWIRCIIKLTQYENVYADISGLDIDNDIVRIRLQRMLSLVHRGHKGIEHLKYKLMFGSGWYLTGRDYGEYCRRFKELFNSVDVSGKLWERVSLVNTWLFYDKIPKLVKDRNVSENISKMKDVFDDPDGLVEYIPCRDNEDKRGALQEPKVERDYDLIANRGDELITLEELYKINGGNNNYCKKYIDALNEVLPKFGINTLIRLAHFLAQVIHESWNLSKKEEIFYFTTLDNLKEAYERLKNEKTDEELERYLYANTLEKKKDLAELVYGHSTAKGRELGNKEEGDGYKYRGRGLMQITGREAYEKCNIGLKKYGIELKDNLVAKPEGIIADAYVTVVAACWFWKDYKQVGEVADDKSYDAIEKITKKINGKKKGIEKREKIFNVAKEVLKIQQD
jgi:putative chitinase